MSLMELLFKRSQFDPGVNSFLGKVLIKNPEYLNTFKLVCKEWNSFIKEQILSTVHGRKYLTSQISRSLRSDPLQILAVKINVDLQERVNDNISLDCDDDLAIIDVSDLDSGAVVVIDLNLLEQKLISLGGFDFNNGESVIYAVGPQYFCTAFSHDNRITLWDKRTLLRHQSGIFSVDCKYIRCIKIFQDFILIVGRSTVYVLYQKDLLIESVNTIDIPAEFGSTRSVVYDGNNSILTAHDRFIQLWTMNPVLTERRLNTGLVVEMALRGDILLTVGSCQNLGLQFWSVHTGQKLKIFFPEQSFYSIKLANDQLLLRGSSSTTVFANFAENEISERERSNCEDDDPYYISDISETKAFFLDVSRQTLLIKHYWQVMSDISHISKSELLPLPLPYENV